MYWRFWDAEALADLLYLALLALTVCGTLGLAAAEVIAQ
jgi:hypothetical protein